MVDARTNDGTTPLIQAVRTQPADMLMVEELIGHHADMNAADNNGLYCDV